jgi:CubicO group peptidase (beta-lactamase class C family)
MSLLPELRSRLAESAARHAVPGAAIAVGRDDELAEAATGVLNRDTGVAATPDSVFQIGSVTKVFTAVLVMQLVDEGIVDLDQPVRRYLPEFGVVDPDVSATVTVRQLLSHTGGFLGDLFEETGRGDDALDRYLDHLRGNATQVGPPGAVYSYCNSGFSVLGAMVARLRGGTWESVVADRLVRPLGLRHTTLSAEEVILYRVAAGHLDSPDGPAVSPRWQLPRSLGPAGTVLCAAPRDLVRFGRLFLSGGTGPDGARLLTADALGAMLAPQVTPPGVPTRGAHRWGLGIALFDWDGMPVIGHDGGTIGQSTLWRVVPEHRVVIAVTANGGAAEAFFDDVVDPVVHELTGVRVPARPTPPATPSTVPIPAAYAGRYTSPLSSCEVTVDGRVLVVTAAPQGIAAEPDPTPRTDRYVRLAGDTFIAVEPADGTYATITFVAGGRYLHSGRALARVD